MFVDVTALEQLHVAGKYRNIIMQHTCTRHAAWDPHDTCQGHVKAPIPQLCKNCGVESTFVTSTARFRPESKGGLGRFMRAGPPAALTPARATYRGTSLIRNSALQGYHSRTMHRALWWVLGGVRFLVSEVPL